MEALLKSYEEDIASITLVPSDGGCFEITVNGTLVYSKLKTGRHIEPPEAVELVRKFLQEG